MEELAKKYEKSGQRGCAYCGGLGHRIGDCPKLKSEAKESSKTKKEYFGSGGCAGGVEIRGAGTWRNGRFCRPRSRNGNDIPILSPKPLSLNPPSPPGLVAKCSTPRFWLNLPIAGLRHAFCKSGLCVWGTGIVRSFAPPMAFCVLWFLGTLHGRPSVSSLAASKGLALQRRFRLAHQTSRTVTCSFQSAAAIWGCKCLGAAREV